MALYVIIITDPNDRGKNLYAIVKRARKQYTGLQLHTSIRFLKRVRNAKQLHLHIATTCIHFWFTVCEARAASPSKATAMVTVCNGVLKRGKSTAITGTLLWQ